MSVWARSGEYDPHYGLEMLMFQGKSGLAEEKCQCGRDQVNMITIMDWKCLCLRENLGWQKRNVSVGEIR